MIGMKRHSPLFLLRKRKSISPICNTASEKCMLPDWGHRRITSRRPHGFRKRLIKIINMLSIRWPVCIIAVRVLRRIMKQLSSYIDDPPTKAIPMRIMSLRKCSGTESERKRIWTKPVNTSNVPSPAFLLWRLKAMMISSNTASARCSIPEPVHSRIFRSHDLF